MDDSDEAYLEPFLNKKYKLYSCDDKFDDVMKTLGIGFVKRHLGMLAKPVMELKKNDDDEYTLAITTLLSHENTTFKIGEEFDYETPDGRKVKSVFYQHKNILTEIQQGKKKTTITREFTDEQLTTTVEVDGIVSTRIYKPYK